MLILRRSDQKLLCKDSNSTITYKDVTDLSEILEEKLRETIYLLPIANTAVSAGLYISLLESSVSFIICGFQDWQKHERVIRIYFKKTSR